VRNLRFGWRTLWRSPGFTLVAVLTLALGIGANTAVLGLAWSVLFRPLPFAEPGRTMVLWQAASGSDVVGPFSIPVFQDLQARNRVFESLAMFRWVDQNLIDGEGEPERLEALMVSSEFLRGLGVEPHSGRGFLAEDDELGAPPTVMMSYELWQRRFGGDGDVVGSSIRLEDKLFTVIGIFPPGLRSESLAQQGSLGDLWLPISLFFDRLNAHQRASYPSLLAIGTLAAGVSTEEVKADLERISRELAVEYPLTSKKVQVRGALLRDFQLRNDRPALQLLVVMVALVLLVACVNLVNLMLSRYASREQELRTRFAMGANRWQIMRLLMVESLLLAMFSGFVGGLFAHLAMRVVPTWISGFVGVASLAGVRVPILEIAVPLSLVSGLLVGTIPAWRATCSAAQAGGSWGRALASGLRLRRVLIVIELALATIVLVAAGLMLGSLERLFEEDLGFQTENLLTLKITPAQTTFEDASAWTSFFDQAMAEVAALPGVREVALSSHVPMVGERMESLVVAGDRVFPLLSEVSYTTYQAVSPNYFQVLGIPLLEGRDFLKTDDDRLGAEHVAIVSQSLARHFWPEKEAVGQKFAFEMGGTPEDPDPLWRRIVGVVGEVSVVEPRRRASFAVYAPYAQRPSWFRKNFPMTLVAKAAGEPSDLALPLRELFAEIAPQSPIFAVQPLASVVDAQFEKDRGISSLLSLFGVLALMLALIGVFGLISLTVSARLREICIRIALGADRSRVAWSLLCQTFLTALLGTAVGCIVAVTSLGPLIEKHLYGLEIHDPFTYLLVTCLLIGAAVLATLIPAWRAVNASPGKVLHHE